METSQTPGLRIGVLSKRAGVSEHVLRAWESRYGLLAPARSSGGFRLYSEDDLRRVHRMREYLGQGLSAAEAARAVLAEPLTRAAAPAPGSAPGSGPGSGPDSRPAAAVQAVSPTTGAALREALDGLDEQAAHLVLDQLFGSLTIETAIRVVLIPYLHDLGERWANGEVTVGQEHFASNVIRSRLAAIAPGWGGGHGPRAVLACPPGELHDIALLSFGLVLRRAGWRVVFLGASSPIDDIDRTAAALNPDLVMLSASDPARFTDVRPALTQLAATWPVALAGSGGSTEFASAIGAEYVTDDPVSAAERWAGR